MAESHSFDIVCKVEMHEVSNAIDQAQKQLATRYDFKGSKSSITLNKDNTITLLADDDFKMKSLTEIVKEKLEKRGIPLKSSPQNNPKTKKTLEERSMTTSLSWTASSTEATWRSSVRINCRDSLSGFDGIAFLTIGLYPLGSGIGSDVITKNQNLKVSTKGGSASG